MSRVLEAWLPSVLQMDHESLFGVKSRWVQLLVCPWPKNDPLLGKAVLLDQAHTFGRDTQGAVREEKYIYLASQNNQINHGD